MTAKHRAHGDVLVCDRLIPERSRKILAPLVELVIELLYGTLKFYASLLIDHIFTLIDGIDLPQNPSRNLVQGYQSDSASHERRIFLRKVNSSKIICQILIVDRNRYLDVAVRVFDTEWTTESKSEHAIQAVYAPPYFSASLFVSGRDRETARGSV
jgi:hypothetical protein